MKICANGAMAQPGFNTEVYTVNQSVSHNAPTSQEEKFDYE